MAPMDTESQFKFLIACIKHTNAGKVDFGKVAEELSIVTKGAAAKRYERLMKAHGIDKTNGGGTGSPGPSGTSAPSTPKTPTTGRKNGNSRATPGSKKRKLAARGDDVDEDEDEVVKPEIKEEIKQESTNTPDGSYMIDPNKPPLEGLAAGTLVNTPDGVQHDCENNDDVLLISESRREDVAAPVSFATQVLVPPSPENFYGFVDPAIHLHRLSQHPVTATGVPIRYEYGNADCTTQMMATLPPDGHHWLHHHEPAFLWSDARVEPQVEVKHD
ncbi:hypothetical protein diail_9760 [Diaporthe ilicicola]|nr:hypothetical protein diail_9760 [Diaporthe ilicicola]